MQAFREGMTGSLKIFSAPDVLQLVSQQKKKGVVYFYKNKTEAAVGFEDGMVIAAYIIREGQFEPLESYLTRSGLVSPADLKTAKQIQEETGEPLEEILVREGIITSEDLMEIVQFKIQEVIDEIITWKEGIYKFEPDKEIYKFSKIKIKLPLDSLLMEAAWRQDEWPRIKEKINDPTMVFRPSKKKPQIDIELEKDEIRVLKLINGKRTVQELVEISGIGKFKTYFALFRLLEMGRIEPVEKEVKIKEEKKEELKTEIKKARKLLPAFLHIVFVGIIVALFFLLKIHKRGIFPKINTITPSYYDEKYNPDLFKLTE